MLYKDVQALKNVLMELPPALEIGRILLILNDMSKRLLSEYPLLNEGNQDFISTLQNVLERHTEDSDPSSDLAYHLEINYDEW